VGPSCRSMSRTIVRKDITPPPEPGFIGEGHTAVEVVRPHALSASDPFVLLMDDRLDIAKRRHIGGAHPHAGLETVTLVLEGTLVDRDEGELSAGDVIWMTAGRGIIHNESVEAFGRSRILQLWIGLSEKDRNAPPRFEVVRKANAPRIQSPGVEGHLYSGKTGALQSPTLNHVPVTLVELGFEAGASFTQDLPASYNGFFYVIEGDVRVGKDIVAKGEVGWLAPGSESELVFAAGDGGARLVLYAGEPIGEPLMQHGPFVAGSPTEIMEFHRRFQLGQFTKMSELAHAARLVG
jgi:redox-sensitive bicupin YhaK (pirin superfamily)